MKERGVFLAVALVLGFGVLALGLAALQPTLAALPSVPPECVPLYAYIKEIPSVNVLTGTATISEVTLIWDGTGAAYAINVNVEGVGAAFTVGSAVAYYDFFTNTYDAETDYKVYVLVDITAAGGAIDDDSAAANDYGISGADMLVKGEYESSGSFPGSDPKHPGTFYVRMDDNVAAGSAQLVGTWTVAVVDALCTSSPFEAPTPTPAPTSTPGPTPTVTPTNPGGIDIYNLPGDYGTVGRLFDFGIILGVAQGLINFIGVDNLRDWIALGAAVAVLFTIIAGARVTTPPQS